MSSTFRGGSGKCRVLPCPFLHTLCAVGSPLLFFQSLPFSPSVRPPTPGSSAHHGTHCTCFSLGSQKTFIMPLGYTKHCRKPHKSHWLQGPRGWQAGPESARVVGQADFLTLQGTVWSRVVGRRPQGPERSWSRQEQWWQSHWQQKGGSQTRCP